ncbi:Protein of unknown function DUF212 [Dillenia turbinata]|uniref:Acid phosphatase/vanadium-dependent haloperoxidase-related protein n=1 Tax=Dillenia turbinata TaxID=194707 RepID=A0AAN8V2W3_9MAGN
MDCSLSLKPSFSFLSFGFSNPSKFPTSTRTFSFLKLYSFRKLKSSVISVSYKSPQTPDSRWNNQRFPSKLFWDLLPIFRNFENWVSGFGKISENEEFNGKYLQNGGIGMALLSVTSTAKVHVSPFLATLAANPTFVSGLVAWAVAQSMKVFLNFFIERKWDFKILFTSGGMPSSHSALCTALTTSVALCHGVADSLFPVCLGFSLIVMYDAIGVRRHAGMQAEVLNKIVEDLFQGHPISQRKLKELLGHTPSQVLGGAVLGILIACKSSGETSKFRAKLHALESRFDDGFFFPDD